MIDLTAWRAEFPVTTRYAYLNHAGVGPISARAAARMHAHTDDLLYHGVAHARDWEPAVEKVRRDCARLVHATPEELALVRSTSHGLALVAAGLPWKAGENVLCAVSEEYPSNVYPWLHLAPRGVRLRPVPAPGGVLSVDAFREAGDAHTRLVAVSSVQYASGFRADLAGLGQLCAEKGWLLCVDGIQSLGCMPVDVQACGIHFLAADSHKWMMGPCGVGLQFVARSVLDRLNPVLVGWRSTKGAWNFDQAVFDLREDAAKLEEGSHGYALIEGLGGAVELLLEVGEAAIWERVQALGDYLVERLQQVGATVCSPTKGPHRSGAVAFVPRGQSPQEATSRMLEAGIIVSCRRNLVRVSPQFYNSEEELDRVVALVR